MSDPMLMSILRFNEAELQANRNGQITETQKERLLIQKNGSKAGSLFIGVVLLLSALIGLGVGIAALIGDGTVKNDLMLRIILFIAFGSIWTLIWGTAGVITIKRAFAKMKITVKRVEGQVSLLKVIHRNYSFGTKSFSEHSTYELRIGGFTFDIHADLPNVMRQEEIYIVYYVDFDLKDKKLEILSAERTTLASVAPEIVPSSIDDMEVIEFVKKGDILKAIRTHRLIYDSNFEDAKSAVEAIRSKIGTQLY